MSKCKTTGLSQTTDWLSYSECPSSMLCKEESTTGHFTKLSMTWKPFRRTAITSDSVWRSIKFTLKTSTICAITPPSAMLRKQWHRSLNECGTARRRRQWRDTWLSFCSPDMVSEGRNVGDALQWVWDEDKFLQIVQSRSKAALLLRNLLEFLCDRNFCMLSPNVRPHLDGRVVHLIRPVSSNHWRKLLRVTNICRPREDVQRAAENFRRPAEHLAKGHWN